MKKTWAYESGDRVWIPACAGITGREGASAFAEFLTYMASLREGSRGEEVTAMGGWQWGRGWRNGNDRFFTSLRCVQNDMLGVRRARKDRGGIGCGFFAGHGSPHPRGQRWGWVAAFCLRRGWHRVGKGILRNGRMAVRDEGGATARIDSSLRCATFKMTCCGAKEDGSPNSRGHAGWGWIPASVFTGVGLCAAVGDGDGSPPPVFTGAGSRREDKGWGIGAGGRAVREPPLRKENIGGHWVHPHPPSSRGQALTFPHQGGRDL